VNHCISAIVTTGQLHHDRAVEARLYAIPESYRRQSGPILEVLRHGQQATRRGHAPPLEVHHGCIGKNRESHSAELTWVYSSGPVRTPLEYSRSVTPILFLARHYHASTQAMVIRDADTKDLECQWEASVVFPEHWAAEAN
jgi:hypothetical protein